MIAFALPGELICPVSAIAAATINWHRMGLPPGPKTLVLQESLKPSASNWDCWYTYLLTSQPSQYETATLSSLYYASQCNECPFDAHVFIISTVWQQTLTHISWIQTILITSNNQDNMIWLIMMAQVCKPITQEFMA